MGFEVKFPRELWPGSSYLADNDDNRAHEINALFKDPDVKCLIALRGGFGSLRLLHRIDLRLISANPKFLVGFSDITILLNYLYEKTGLVSLHGPVVTALSKSTPESLERLYRSLTGTPLSPIEINNLEVIREGGSGRGVVVGGNLASLVTMLGTRADYSWDHKIVVLEDINEPLYKVDRMLTQLALAGKFNKVAAILVGDFSLDSGHDPIETLRYRESVWQRLTELCPNRETSIWANFPAGHGKRNLTFPIGSNGELDKDKKRLNLHCR